MLSMLDWAQRYVDNGISVIPMEPYGKQPAKANWIHYADRLATSADLKGWFGEGHEFSMGNLGIVLGPASGLWALDADGFMAVERVNALIRDGIVPSTLMRAATPRGQHYYFSIPAGDDRSLRSRPGIDINIDIKGPVACMVAPPSLHRLGSYEWINGFVNGYRPPELHPDSIAWPREKALS